MDKLTRTELTTILQAMSTALTTVGGVGSRVKVAMISSMITDNEFLTQLEVELSKKFKDT